MKNHADAIIFHTAICAEVSQSSPDPTAEIKDFLLRYVMEVVLGVNRRLMENIGEAILELIMQALVNISKK